MINFFEIEHSKIGYNYPVYFIADIAANHDGDLEKAKDLIYLAADAGANAAKFQHFSAETIVSDYGFKTLKQNKSHQSEWKKSVFDIYKDASVNLDWTHELIATCKKAGITFFTTPYSLEIIDYLDNYVPAYKIGSGDITWLNIIEYIAKKDKPTLLATGASSLDEVSKAVNLIQKHTNKLCLMQCNTNYTASLENFKYINLNVLNKYKQLFPNVILGLSDHTPGCTTVLGAVSLGARVIEKHFTNSNFQEGPDHKFSMNPQSWKKMILMTRELENALGSDEKKVEDNELDSNIVQRRSLRAKFKIKKNSIFNINDFIPLRPAPKDSYPLQEIDNISPESIINREIPAGDYLKASDIN